MSKEISLRAAQEIVDQWITGPGVRYFSELTNLAILAEEVGEVARLMARQYGDQSFKGNENEAELGEELADVLFVLLAIANQTGTDLTAAFQAGMQKREQRDADRHKQNPKLQ